MNSMSIFKLGQYSLLQQKELRNAGWPNNYFLNTSNIYTFTLHLQIYKKKNVHFYVMLKGADSSARWWKFLIFIELFIHLE